MKAAGAKLKAHIVQLRSTRTGLLESDAVLGRDIRAQVRAGGCTCWRALQKTNPPPAPFRSPL